MNRTELAALRDAIDQVMAWPPAVLAEVARWLAPAVKPNGLDLHPPPVLAKRPPKVKAARPAKPNKAQTAERKLLAAMRDNPGLSVIALANAASAGRSATGERLRQLAARGAVEKDSGGHWPLKAEEAAARPMLASPS